MTWSDQSILFSVNPCLIIIRVYVVGGDGGGIYCNGHWVGGWNAPVTCFSQDTQTYEQSKGSNEPDGPGTEPGGSVFGSTWTMPEVQSHHETYIRECFHHSSFHYYH